MIKKQTSIYLFHDPVELNASESQTDSLSAMRTRFITDFFNSSDASQSLQTLEFLRFPPPQLPTPNIFNFDNLSCFDQVASLIISPEIERFSFNEVLSKFFSDVLPQHINAEIDQHSVKEVTSEDKINGNLDGVANTISAVLAFETPELHSSLIDYCSLHEEKMQIFFKVADAEVNLDLLDFSLEVQQLTDIQKSIFHIEDYHIEFQEEHRSDFSDNGSLVQGQISSNLRTFPFLEIDETSLGINTYITEDKHIIFESNDPELWMQKDESTCDVNEHLLSMEFNILEHLLNHPPVTSHEFEVSCVNFSPEDIINAIDHQITSSPFSFEPPKFFDVNTSHFSEVFSDTELIREVEDCEQMFSDTPLSTFNGLIVKHELILRDGSFKSLPVPIISDHEKTLSVQEIVEEILQKLKLQPSSTSDDIYLDWHLLDEDISSHNISTSLKMFKDIETYTVDTYTNSDNQISILEFLFSDSCSNEKKSEEKTEVLNVQTSGNLMDHDGISSSKLNDNVNKAHELVESMSQFDNLDFFLNPLEATYVKKQKAADKKLEMDFALPVVSAKIPIETHDASKKHQSLEHELHSVKGGDFHSTSTLNESIKNSEGLLHSTSVKENNNMESLEATNVQITKLPSAMESNKISTNTPSLPDAIIIVNTQNIDTEMIISRRTTYRRILAMEKKGVQVVERDLNLPVDVIVNAAVCLVWYDSKNIRKKTTSEDGGSSCVENIAVNVLTSVSFSFSGCILIFEGEVGFLSGVMESSDELYAAAASLGIDLQIFYSYSFETTDEIILNCITHATKSKSKSTTGLYSTMPESETLAESFLTKFPSINPLSAHAILSSVGSLLQFFEMSHQQRVSAVQKYGVPDQSITLFSALCKYGEREDSRSGMTDCCSSVSSGHDSGNCYEPKKRKYIRSPETRAVPLPMPLDYSFRFEKNNDVSRDAPKTVLPHSYWNLEADDIGENQRSDPNMMPNMRDLTGTEMSFGQRKFESQTNYNPKDFHEEYKGQVIDIDDDDVAGEDFSFGPRKMLSSDWFRLPSFPTAAEITSDLESWIPTKDRKGITPNSLTDLMNYEEECSIVNYSPMNLCKRTPLTKAISSAEPQKGSPWTIDFLNRIKEKSRLRQQSLPGISSAPSFGYSGNSSKFRKRKSPSILDFYRYKRNSTNNQSSEHKQQKVLMQPSVKTSQTWTPIDKRSKRKLTFATDGSKGQSKLIWSDKTDQTLNRRF